MAEAMERHGHRVEPFSWHGYVAAGAGRSRTPGLLLRKAQNKYLVGPLIARVNRDLIERVSAAPCELLFVYRGTHITRGTLEAIRERSPLTRLVGYNNDDPFTPGQPPWLWRHFIGAIPAYDRVLAYRPHNVDDFRAAGARSTGLLLPWFVPSVHHPVTLTEEDRRRYESDVVFIGHYEPDHRQACLEGLAEAGVRLRVFGPGVDYRGYDWHGPLSRSAPLRRLMPVHEIWDAEYTRALNAAKIALCFFSKRNRDRYTRRCFEIPATGTMLMSEYSPELAEMYREGVDAEFFRTPEELVEKVRFYLAHPEARDAVAKQGYERVHRDGHDVDSRVRQMLDDLGGAAQFERAG
jgi:hypothetical protein